MLFRIRKYSTPQHGRSSLLASFSRPIRYGDFLDPYGQIWSVGNSTDNLQDVPKELARKMIPFVSVRDAAGYITFLTEVFGAETMYPPAKHSNGKVRDGRFRLRQDVVDRDTVVCVCSTCWVLHALRVLCCSRNQVVMGGGWDCSFIVNSSSTHCWSGLFYH